ncbi:MAG: hypothetical protein V3R92_04885 [Dehalococcoidales bacterium]
MFGFCRKIIKGQKGQVLPAVLALLVIGGLTIAPGLNYTATSLNGSRIVSEDISGIYAADAGVTEVLWALENSQPPPSQTSDNVNRMAVAMQTELLGVYTLYLGELIEPGKHNDYLDIDSTLTWDEGADAYQYTIIITWNPESGAPVIHFEEVGARIPIGYSYQPDSAAAFAENLSTGEPEETLDSGGAFLLNWGMTPPLPEVSQANPVATQSFYVTGNGDLEGDYSWVVANRADIGAVGEITGTEYRITATAARPEDGVTTATIVANVMLGGTTSILSWHISN